MRVEGGARQQHARGPASARAGARACAALNITAIYMYLYLDSGMMLQAAAARTIQ